MARKMKKAPERKAAAKKKARTVKRTKRAPARKKIVRRKKPESKLEKFENALMVGLAEADDIAMEMGLLTASVPKKRKTRR